MTSKVSQEEYQNLMKLLQSRRTSGAIPTVKDTLNGSSGRRATDLTRNVDNHVTRKNKLGLLDEDDDSDSGYTNSISQPPSTSNLLSSGTSVDSATDRKTTDGSAKSDIPEALKESGRESVKTIESSVLSKDNTHVGDQISPLKEEETAELSSRQPEPDEGNFVHTTPSKLLQKRTDREFGSAAGGVGSFQSFTSPSVLMSLDSSDSGSHLSPAARQRVSATGKSGQPVGVGSFESFTAPSQLLLMAQEDGDDKTTKSSLPLQVVEKTDEGKSQDDSTTVSDPSPVAKDELPRKLLSDVELGTVSIEDEGSASPPKAVTSLDLESTDRQWDDPESSVCVDTTFFQYSTPSNMLLRREQRLKAEDAGGVGSFQSFTTPSELFTRKDSVCSNPSAFKQIDLNTEQPDTYICKSSMDQFHLNTCPSELLKLKTELAINERIASTKSLHQPQGKTQEEEKFPEEVLRPPSLRSDVSDGSEIVMEDIEVNLSVDGTSPSEEEQHVTFGGSETSAEEPEAQALPTSSGSDISLIMEEFSEYIQQENSDMKEDLNSSMGRPGKPGHLVVKAKSYPLVHLQHATLCHGGDTIQCECSDKESVEKLVGHDFVKRKTKESVETVESQSLEKSHSWADDTWQSLELVLERHQDMEKEEDVWEPKANHSYTPRNDAGANDIQEEYEKLKQANAEKDWILMEAKLEHSRLLVQNRKEMTQEKAQLVQKYHRAVDELTEQRDAAEFKLKKQAEEIHFLEEEAWGNRLDYTTQLTSLREENLHLREIHRRQAHWIETLKDQLHGLVVELDGVKAEETRLRNLLSDKGEEPSTEICGVDHDREMKTAHAKIFVELDEDQNKFTIDTEVDREFICGDGTKTDEELHGITEALTKFVRDELLLNVIPLLYPSSSCSVVDCDSSADTSPDDTPTACPSSLDDGGPGAPGASVTITLGNQEDTKVKIKAEMDAGFLGEGKKDEEVEIITQKVAQYVQDHFLEGMLQRLFPGRDVKSMFAISSDIFSSSLHNLNVPGVAVMEHQEGQTVEKIEKGPSPAIEASNVTSTQGNVGHKECQAVETSEEEGPSPAVETLTSNLTKAQAEVTALQSIVRKQELEKSQLSEKYERRGEQLKDVCCQFTESERRWTDEKDVMKKRLMQAEEESDDLERNLDLMKKDGSQKEREVSNLKELVSGLQAQLQESVVKIEHEVKTREAAQREVDDIKLGIRKSQDEKEELIRRLEEKEKTLESLSSDSESQRASLEAHLSHYKEVLNDKVLKLKALEESKEQVDGIRLLEKKVSTLKMENSHLKTSLEALTPPYDLPTSPRVDGKETFTDRQKTAGIVSIPWNKYRFLLADNQQLASRVNELEKEKDDHMKRGRLLDEELRRFQGEMGSLKTCIAQLTGDLRDALLESKNLEHKIETGELRAEFKLQAQIRETEEMKEKKQKELMSKLTSLEDETMKLRGERDSWTDELKKLGEEKARLQGQLTKSIEELRSCQGDLKRTKELLNVKQAQLSTASTLLEEMRYEKGGMSSKILDLYQELLKTQTDVERAKDSSRENIIHLQSQVSSLEKSLLCHEKDMARMESELKQARSDLEETQSSNATKDDALQQLQMEKDEALVEVTSLQQKLQDTELKTLVMNEAQQKKEEEMERMTNRLSSLMSEAELSRRELDGKNKDVEAKAQRLESLETELHSKAEEVIEERSTREELEWQLKEERQEHIKVQEILKTLEDENASLNQQLKSIQLEKEREQSAYGLLQQQYQTLHDSNTRLDCKSETDREFNRFLRVELEKSKDEVEKLKDTTRGLQSEVEQSKRKIEKKGEDLDRSISESQSEIGRLESLLDEATESQKTLEDSNKDQAEALEAEMQKVAVLTEDLEQLQKEFVEERMMVKKLQEEKDNLRSRLDAKIEKLSNQKNNLQDRLYQAEVNAKVDQCRQEAQSRQMLELKSYFEKQMSDNGATSQRVDALMKEIQTLQEKNCDLNRTIDSMEDRCDTLMKEVEEKKRGMSDLSARLSLAEHQSRTYQQRIEELEVEIQKEKNLAESVKNVNKEKKKRWLLSNQLFSSKIKAQLESSDEKIRELQDELMRVSHQNQLQSSEVSEKAHMIESLQERTISLEESETSLMEELQKTKRQLGKERDLVQSLSERLLKKPDQEKSSNLIKCDSSFCSRTHLAKPVEAEEKMMKSDMQALEAEMKKNLKEEIKDHVKNVTKQFIMPRKSDYIEDIAAGISEMRQQHHQEREKIDNLSANLDALNSTLLERLTPTHHSTLAPPNPKRRLSSVAEMNHAIRRANLRATSRRNGTQMTFDPQADSTGNPLQPEASLLNNSTVLAGSSDLFYIPESS